MKQAVDSFIVGMAAGAAFADGRGLVVSIISVVAFGLLNAYLGTRRRAW